MMRKFLLACILGIVFSSAALAKKDVVNIYEQPREVPPFTLYHSSGKRYKLSDFKGEFVLVVFWSKKCAVCIRELDDLNNFSNMVRDNGIRVIAVSPSTEWRDTLETKRFLERYGAPDLEVFLDENGDMAASFGIFATPHNVLINRKGQEMGRIRGGADWDSKEVIEFMYNLKAKN